VVHDLGASEQRGGAGTNASQVAAETLRSLFCDGTGCAADHVEPLYARANARRAESAAELEAQRAARERARIAAENVVPPRLVEQTDIEFPLSLQRRKVEGRSCSSSRSRRAATSRTFRVDASDLPTRFRLITSPR